MSRTPKPDDFQPVKDFPKDHAHYGKPRCTAWSPNQGRQCLGIAKGGTGKCRVHGGNSPKGLASPNWETGRWSSYLQTGIGEKYKRAYSDPELLDRAADIALIDTRIAELVEGLENAKEKGYTWQDALNTFDDIRKAFQDDDPEEAQMLMNELGRKLRSGYNRETQWGKIQSALMKRNNIANSQENRLVKMQMLLAVEDQMMILDYLSSVIRDSIRKHVEERDKQQRILEEISSALRKLIHGETRE